MYAEHLWCDVDVISLKSSVDVSGQGDGAVFIHTEDFQTTYYHHVEHWSWTKQDATFVHHQLSEIQLQVKKFRVVDRQDDLTPNPK
jgi:hypothetical protein